MIRSDCSADVMIHNTLLFTHPHPLSQVDRYHFFPMSAKSLGSNAKSLLEQVLGQRLEAHVGFMLEEECPWFLSFIFVFLNDSSIAGSKALVRVHIRSCRGFDCRPPPFSVINTNSTLPWLMLTTSCAQHHAGC